MSNDRLWGVVVLLLAVIFGMLGTVVQREIDQINARLDHLEVFTQETRDLLLRR